MNGDQWQVLRDIRNLIIDMDGVLYRGTSALPGVSDFIEFLSSASIKFILATNNSTRTPEHFRGRLASMGITVDHIQPKQIVTSSVAAAQYLVTYYPPPRSVYCVGEEGLEQALSQAGYTISAEQASVVVAGLDRNITYDRLKTAGLLIREGAAFVATNPDPVYPTHEGLVPGAGTIVAAVEAAGGVRPIVVGKPETFLFELCLNKLGAQRDDTAVLGDGLFTDIAGGRRAKLTTILVLTGVTTAQDLLDTEVSPDLYVADLPALVAGWQSLLGT
jgi:4-nitrophenyl phosphatase